ncbi:HlyD family efflux transporter periplasmic adaptor subunit [Sorangium sp. So ce260]|uniref:HlyD family efflux transporter periplasmic adaptor subunit n=1 Tax=Sorangium sp. So ce260 TaxID=3133291 RepID=UPI003F5DCF9C
MMITHRLRGALQDAAPWLCLVATLGVTSYLHFGGDERGPIVGFEQPVLQALAPTEIARVASIHVGLNDEVAPGQVVAMLDTSTIDAEIAVAQAEAAQLEAEARAEQALLAQELDMTVEELQRELAQQREEHRQVSAEAKVLGDEVSRVKQLVEDRLAVLDDLSKLNVQQAAAAALAEEKPRTLGLLARQIQVAEQRRQEARRQPPEAAAKLQADLLVARRNVELLEQRRASYALRATHGGRVAGIDKQVGDVAAPGEPVVRVVSSRGAVVACVPERFALGLAEGDAVRLWVRGQRGEPLPGKIAALGPLVAELPIRCWTSPRQPMWGREVSIALDYPMNVLAGQAFDVVFRPGLAAQAAAPSPPAAAPSPPAAAPSPPAAAPSPPAAAPSPPAAAPSPPAAARALAMQVPPALAQRSRFEPSGLLARPGEGRYLIVSDDTGHDGKEDEGAPWLFTMSATGAVDPEPAVVEGIDELVDVEGIAAGDAGEIYLLSSQSYNKKGRRKPGRTALLRVRRDGASLRVDGEIHLAEMLDASAERAAALGLPRGTRELDVEGLAFHQGALYLGLKAPLDAQGKAMIWRIASPGALFPEGRPSGLRTGKRAGKGKGAEPPVDPKRLDHAGVSLWARARVDVDLAGRATPGGISDLLFLPDGSLAIASTPSTADGDAGALFRVDSPQPGDLAPRLVQRFPGLKPEGIAPSLSAGKLMIVFDAGANVPSFQELSWGR